MIDEHQLNAFGLLACLPAEGLLARGRVWALLALLRLHLLLPPVGADPAAKYGLVRQHTLSLLRCQVEPELAVRRQHAALPGAPLCSPAGAWKWVG